MVVLRPAARCLLVGLLAAVALSGCETESGGALIVDLRTDLRPGYEFTRARVYLLGAGTSSEVRQERAFVVGDEEALLDGVRIGDFEAIDLSSVSVRVALIEPGGRSLLERVIRVSGLDESRAITAVFGRACRGVQCPDSAGSPELTECFAGRCVDPSCVPEEPGSCGTPMCTSAAECGGLSSCATGDCGEGGVCFQLSDDSRCEADEWCLPEEGCIPLESTMDGGLDAATDGALDGTHDAPFDASDAGSDVAVETGPDAASTCGDGVVDLGEICDDGNAIAADGCSPACRLEGDTCADALDMAVVGALEPDGSLSVASSLARATDSITGHATFSTPDRIYFWDAPADGWMLWSTDTAALEFDSYLCSRSVCTDPGTSLGCNDDRGTIMSLAAILHVEVASGDRVYTIVEPNEAGCCVFDLSVRWRRYLEPGEACTPSFWEDDCRPPSRCTAVDGGNACQ